MEMLEAAVLFMDKKNLKESRGIIPGYENGHYEPATNYDRSEFKNYAFENPHRRDHRISIRISGNDMEQLHKLSLAEGMPSQSLLANIVHNYLNGSLPDVPMKLGERDCSTQKNAPIPVDQFFL